MWNEANTFAKLIFPYLEHGLGYPARESTYVDEQTWVRKRGEQSGPYDCVFQNQSGVLLLIEAKREGHALSAGEIEQAFDYALGPSFVAPPPFVLVSNGKVHKWFRRVLREGDFLYIHSEEIHWEDLERLAGSGVLKEEVTLKQLITILKKIRKIIFDDLAITYFPDDFKLTSQPLAPHVADFRRILETRKSYVAPELKDEKEEEQVRNVLSSIALSLTLKVLFIKLLSDRERELFVLSIRTRIEKMTKQYPGILKASPYDVLQFSDFAEQRISSVLTTVSILAALLFHEGHNPIGDIWDGLVISEEQDLQVKSLGNVYTPHKLVLSMIDAAERSLRGWRSKRVLEPACGSGHFVRELFRRMRDSYLSGDGDRIEVAVNAHRKAMDNLRAIDIDPFAVQTTQMGFFLELYRTREIWERLTQRQEFDLSSIIACHDFLDDGFSAAWKDFQPDLIIGNPPYGVDVTRETADHYGLTNNDSYGCFIVRALKRLKENGFLQYVVSDTWLTLSSFYDLRRVVLSHADVTGIMKLNRHVFASRDVFCCFFEAKKRRPGTNPGSGSYRFVDAWPVRPNDPDFERALSLWGNERGESWDRTRVEVYLVPLSCALWRLDPPNRSTVQLYLKQGATAIPRRALNRDEKAWTLCGGLPSIYLYASDVPIRGRLKEGPLEFPRIGSVNGLHLHSGGQTFGILKLWQIAEVLQGLATADDYTFTRKTPGVVPNARRRNIRDVEVRNTLDAAALVGLSEAQKKNGIPVIDPQRDRYFVPFDKGGEQEVGFGHLRSLWAPIDYWIDWSEASVSELRRRSKWPAGTKNKPFFRNVDYYFRRGIIGTTTGLYAPTYRLSFGGVFGHKANLILPFEEGITNYLLVLLSSTFMRYIAKQFISATVDFSTDCFKMLPIAVPNEEQFLELTGLCDRLIERLQVGEPSDMRVQKQIDDLVFRIYGIRDEDREEIGYWFKRRYPLFGGDAQVQTTN